MQHLDVLYQWGWGVVPKRTYFLHLVFKKIKIGMDKAYQKQLLSNTKIIKGNF
jgi:hypothetical protein